MFTLVGDLKPTARCDAYMFALVGDLKPTARCDAYMFTLVGDLNPTARCNAYKFAPISLKTWMLWPTSRSKNGSRSYKAF